MSIIEWLQSAYFGISLIGIAFLIWTNVTKKDESLSLEIKEMKSVCPYKHEKIDYIIGEIKNSLKNMEGRMTLIQENDIKHIETEMRHLNDVQIEILTTLKVNKEIS